MGLMLKLTNKKDTTIIIITTILVFSVYLVSFYDYYVPKKIVREVTIFDTWISGENTVIKTYNDAAFSFQGVVELEKDATYRLVFINVRRSLIIDSFEKIIS
jgi:hypothetical protein